MYKIYKLYDCLGSFTGKASEFLPDSLLSCGQGPSTGFMQTLCYSGPPSDSSKTGKSF